MNVAIVGSTGYIASYLLKRFEKETLIEKILKIDQNEKADVCLDLQNAKSFDYSILAHIDFIVFTAAVSGPDKCSSEFDLCWKINVEGTKYFIREALSRNCRVLFFSSDAVFGDIPGCIYTEKSDTKAVTPYGRMKKAVEDAFKENAYFKAIRLSYVVSERDRFITYCLNCIKKEETAEVFHPFYRNCIVVSDVVNVVMWFALHFDEYEPFVLNVAGKELVSRVRIADELNRILGNRLVYTISIPGEDFFANRPKITQMRSLYLKYYNILEETSFTEKIQKELEGIKL